MHMTRFLDNCSVCDEPQTTDLPTGGMLMGSVDLDLGGPSGIDSLWPGTSVTCIGCGACGVTIWDFPASAHSFVRSEAYREVASTPWPPAFRNEMAAGLLAEHLGWWDYAFNRYLVASWIAEDLQLQPAAGDGGDSPEQSARRRAVNAWVGAAGDPTAEELPRCTELAAATVVGHALLDNQVLMDLLRRLGEWDRAEAAARSARRGIAGTLQAWDGLAGLWNDDERAIVEACGAALALEEQLIAHRDSSRVGARLDLPAWFAE